MYENCLYFNLNAFTRQLNKLWEDEFAQLGLSPSHGYLLRFTLEDPGLSQRELAEKMSLAASTVTRFLESLEKKGFIRRSSSPDDARTIKVYPTKKAEALKKDLDRTTKKLSSLLTEKLGSKYVDDLMKILRQHQEVSDSIDSSLIYSSPLILKERIMANNIVNTGDQTFESDVLKAQELVLVDFWAEWCGPCKALAPKLEEVATELDGKARIAKLDVDAHPDLAAQYGVRGIPTMVLFKNGQEIDRLVGNQPKDAIVALFKRHS